MNAKNGAVSAPKGVRRYLRRMWIDNAHPRCVTPCRRRIVQTGGVGPTPQAICAVGGPHQVLGRWLSNSWLSGRREELRPAPVGYRCEMTSQLFRSGARESVESEGTDRDALLLLSIRGGGSGDLPDQPGPIWMGGNYFAVGHCSECFNYIEN
jgi:hypothetical protein